MIAALTPPGVAVAEHTAGTLTGSLLPEERAALGNATEGRVREFATGRSCARQALAVLGVTPAPILRGADRQPLWPAGVVGSITHCRGYCGAAVARRADFASLGVDAEPNEPLPYGVIDHVALPQEQAWIRQRSDGVHWDRLLFCAKEAVFKAWYPLTEHWLRFADVLVHWEPERGAFRADVLDVDRSPRAGQPAPPACFAGRLAVSDGLLFALVLVSADGVSAPPPPPAPAASPC